MPTEPEGPRDLEATHEVAPDRETMEIDWHIEASPDDVWRALTGDEGFAGWMGSGATIEPLPGGAMAAPDPATGRARRGNVLSVEPGRELRWLWWADDDPAQVSTVTIELEPRVDGTRVHIVETLGPETPARTSASALAGPGQTCGAGWIWRLSMLALVAAVVSV